MKRERERVALLRKEECDEVFFIFSNEIKDSDLKDWPQSVAANNTNPCHCIISQVENSNN